MTRLLFAFTLPLLFAAGAAPSQDRPVRLAADIAYEAKGAAPDWQLAVGDRIVLRLSPVGEDGFVTLQYFPRTHARNADGVRRWESRTPGGTTIVIEVREQECTLGTARYRDTVTVTTGERRLTGCGGRALR